MTSVAEDLRIGGEFELDPASFSLAPEQPAPSLPSNFAYWTDTGRSALLLAARDILRHGGTPVVWLPAFCCHSVTQPFQQAGFRLLYYSATELHGEASAPPTPQPGETVLMVHYFGHRNQPRLAMATAWGQAGIHIVAEAAHSGLTTRIGGSGHYAFTSLRKFLPQPDGALIGSCRAMSFSLADPDESFVSSKVLAKLMRGAHATPETFLSLIEQTESRLDRSEIVPKHPSWLTRQLMLRTDLVSVASRRRANWHTLNAALNTELCGNLTPLFPELS